MNTLLLTPDLVDEAHQVLALPTMQPGTILPYFMWQHYQVAEFARRVADLVLGTSTPPLQLERPPEEAPQPQPPAAGGAARLVAVTRSQLDALLEMPGDWFAPSQLRRAGADALCRRLVARQALEARPANGGPAVDGAEMPQGAEQQHYRKIPGVRYEVPRSRRRSQ